MASSDERNSIARILATVSVEAGAVLASFRAENCDRALKPDGSFVTEADKATERFILKRLAQAFPGWPVISEENEASHALATPERFFLVDPLDGTRAFLAGRADYCVLIALVIGGVPVAGALHAPATGEAWWAGDIAFRARAPDLMDGSRIEPRPMRVGGTIAMISREHAAEASRNLCIKLGITETRSENSALKFARLLEGEADLYPRIGRTMQWDIAAGDALLRAIGGGVFDLEGRPLRYGAGALGWANPDFVARRITE